MGVHHDFITITACTRIRSLARDALPLKSGPEFSQLLARRPLLRLGPRRPQVHISDRPIELRGREIIPAAFDPVVEMIAGRQRRLQQVAAEEFVNEQRGDVALSGRRIIRCPLAGRR